MVYGKRSHQLVELLDDLTMKHGGGAASLALLFLLFWGSVAYFFASLLAILFGNFEEVPVFLTTLILIPVFWWSIRRNLRAMIYQAYRDPTLAHLFED